MLQTLIDNRSTILAALTLFVTGLVGALRLIAPLTTWTGDNWLLAKLEAFLAWFIVPGRYRQASSNERALADNVKFPPGGDRPA